MKPSAAAVVDVDDAVYWGEARGRFRKETLSQSFPGCGHLADTIDGNKVLLENGTPADRGPNYVIRWKK